MSTAIAAVNPMPPSAFVEATVPMVLIDGAVEPALQVQHWSASLENDRRSATLLWTDADTRAIDRLRGRTVTLAVPHALTDGEMRWQVFASGVLSRHEDDESVGTDRSILIMTDRLAAMLDEPADMLGNWPTDGLTLEAMLNRLAMLLSAEFVALCDPALLEAEIAADADRRVTMGQLLSSVLTSAGLRLSQSLNLERDQVRRTLHVLPDRAGRVIALPWPDGEGRSGAVIKIDASADQQPPRAWIAQGDRPIVEDTFALVQGWDPALTGQPDSDYDRLTSSDFSRFGSVYRAWVLNEDGAFTDTPFNQGDAFDVGALFDAPATITTALRLGNCLARDASGRAIPPVIESSLDSGASWSAYPGLAEVMTDRAGVLLVDDALPVAILSAAKAGTLRMRVTATLTSPAPIQAMRWDGNPFVGPGPTRVVRFGDRFGWRRVAPGSIHAGAIAAGDLTADTTDDRVDLRTALQDEIARSPGPAVDARVVLAGAWTAIRVGDRVRAVLGPDTAIDGTPAAFAKRLARVREMRVDFGVSNNTPRTRLYFD